MIVDKDIHPERKIYYFGALVIEILKQLEKEKIDYFTLYQELNKKKKLSINIFSLTLDWLYMIEVIDGSEGYIKRCF